MQTTGKTTDWRKKVPKANLIHLSWSRNYFYFANHRLANCRRFQVGWLTVLVRAPWLEHVARVHYPELFERQGSGAA